MVLSIKQTLEGKKLRKEKKIELEEEKEKPSFINKCETKEIVNKVENINKDNNNEGFSHRRCSFSERNFQRFYIFEKEIFK